MAMRVTSKPWFGPKRSFGWGWTPVSWEGWVVIGAFMVLLLVCVVALQRPISLVAVTVLMCALLAVCLLTGDPPG